MAEDKTDWLAELNPEQRRAVTHGSGPLLVVAGAGSGKTKTLASRVAFLISQGIQPEKILLLTFTRRASEEMLKRAASVASVNKAQISRVWGGTFHATANRLLRIYAQAAGLSPDFTIMDQSDAEDMVNVIRNDMGMAKKESRFPRKGTCLAIYSRRMNGQEELELVLKRYFPWCESWKNELNSLFKEYVERKQKRNILDYDDLLLYWYYLLDDAKIAASIESRFDHILVDEYQDTNLVQAGILHGMRQKNKNIMVVGDDAQSIYSFRSATVRNMLDFPKQFPETTVVALEQNYRSVETILATTNRVIGQAKERFSKELWSKRIGGQKPQLVTCKDENHQDEIVIKKVLDHYEQGIPLRRQAVLFRASSHSATLEIELTRKNIPFRKYGGLKFLEAAHVKDLIALLRILENPRDEIAWFRILQLLNGIGPATAAQAYEHIALNNFNPTSIASFKGPTSAAGDLHSMTSLMKDLCATGTETPAVQIERIRRFYNPILTRVYENPDVRKSDLEHLEQMAQGYTSRSKFLAELILDPPVSTADLAGPPLLDEDYLILSTIHSAKGCEWDAVYLIHAADGCIPSDMSTGSVEEIEEELRLAYVAMTRAKDFLYVLWPLRYYSRPAGFSDNHVYAQASRFFSKEVVETMEQLAFAPDEVAADGLESLKAEKDIGSKIKGLWS